MTAPGNLHLPHGLRVLAEAAGAEAALAIAMARGGGRLEIPKRAEGSVLEALAGVDAARAIVAALAGERLTIPLGKRHLNAWLREQGWSQERRAVALKASRRAVQGWDAADSGRQPAPVQGDLWCR